MKKVGLFIVAVAFAAFANAAEIVVKPQGWKTGDVRKYDCVTVDKDGEILNHAMYVAVNSVEKDKYLMDYQLAITDTASHSYQAMKMILGDSVTAAMNDFVYKFSLNKNGEFGHFENYQDLNALFGKGLMAALVESMVGSSQKDAEDKYLSEMQNVYWYMNKKFDDKKENVIKRDFTVMITVFDDVETKVRVGSLEGKQTFVLTANISAEKVFATSEKTLRETMNNIAKSMGVQPSMFEDKIKEKLDELKKAESTMAIKETVVFDEKTGWFISFDRVVETTYGGETSVVSRCTTTSK